MKIVALVPVKNEAWVLPAYLASILPIADQIIALDDNSTDASVQMLLEAGATVEKLISADGARVTMSERRRQLLSLGRKAGGTHFIWLDADEAFTRPFVENGRELIAKLQPGKKMILQWLALWKSPFHYRDDLSVWSNNYKDFIVHDHPNYFFEEKFFSEGRTQGPNTEELFSKLSLNEGAVLHYQFALWDRFQLKQAWYRCLELINSPDAVDSINATYAITLDDSAVKLREVPGSWLMGNFYSGCVDYSATESWHMNEIINFFDIYGIEFFEKLQIWHIESLRCEFLRRLNREPKKINADRFFKKSLFGLYSRLIKSLKG